MPYVAVWISLATLAVSGSAPVPGPGATPLATAPTPLAAVTCASMALDPVVPHETHPGGEKRILQRFYEATDGVGGLGCWVHPHANGKDYVVTPHSWGPEPNEGRRGLIEDAFQTQTDAFDRLSEVGTLDVSLFILLTDLEGDVEAYWIQENRCWIEAGPSAGFGSHPRDSFQESLAHEIGHCFVMENMPGATFETYADGADAWWDESGAEFFGSVSYPARDFEHTNSFFFDMDGQEFFQAYYAVVLLQHYANKSPNGNRAVLDLLIGFHEAATSDDALRDHVDHASLDAFFHNFGLTHYQGMVVDPGGGYMLAEHVVVAYERFDLTPPTGTLALDSVPPRRLNVVELIVPEAHDAVLRMGSGVGDAFHASAFADGVMWTSWDRGIEMRGECQSSRTYSVFLTTLRRAGVRDVELTYELVENSDCEDEAEMMAACQGMPALPVCMVGTWRMDDESIRGMLGSRAPVSGRVFTRFFENGAFIHRFDDLAVHDVSYDRFGKMKMEILQQYSGDIRGCATSVNAPRLLDRALPLQTEATSDRVVRHTYIRHAGREGNETREDGLQAYHWPNKSTYSVCGGDELVLGQREYRRVSR